MTFIVRIAWHKTLLHCRASWSLAWSAPIKDGKPKMINHSNVRRPAHKNAVALSTFAKDESPFAINFVKVAQTNQLKIRMAIVLKCIFVLHMEVQQPVISSHSSRQGRVGRLSMTFGLTRTLILCLTWRHGIRFIPITGIWSLVTRKWWATGWRGQSCSL